MASICDITEDLISKMVATDDLTEALFDFQGAIGVDSGDVAARVFGFGWAEEWPGSTAGRRREMLDRYIEQERHYTATKADEGEEGEAVEAAWAM